MQTITVTRQLIKHLSKIPEIITKIEQGEEPTEPIHKYLKPFKTAGACQNFEILSTYLDPFIAELRKSDDYKQPVVQNSPDRQQTKQKEQPKKIEVFTFLRFAQAEQNLVESPAPDEQLSVRYTLMLQLLGALLRSFTGQLSDQVFELCQRALVAITFSSDNRQLCYLQLQTRCDFISAVARVVRRHNELAAYAINEELTEILKESKDKAREQQQQNQLWQFLALITDLVQQQFAEIKQQSEAQPTMTAEKVPKVDVTPEQFLKFHKNTSDFRRITSAAYNALVDIVTCSKNLIQQQPQTNLSKISQLAQAIAQTRLTQLQQDAVICDQVLKSYANPAGYQFITEFGQMIMGTKPEKPEVAVQMAEKLRREAIKSVVDLFHLCAESLVIQAITGPMKQSLYQIESAAEHIGAYMKPPVKYLMYLIDTDFTSCYYFIKNKQVPEGNYQQYLTETVTQAQNISQMFTKFKQLVNGADLMRIEASGKLFAIGSCLKLAFSCMSPYALSCTKFDAKDQKLPNTQLEQLTQCSWATFIAPNAANVDFWVGASLKLGVVAHISLLDQVKYANAISGVIDDVIKTVFGVGRDQKKKDDVFTVIGSQYVASLVIDNLVQNFVRYKKHPSLALQALPQIRSMLELTTATNMQPQDIQVYKLYSSFIEKIEKPEECAAILNDISVLIDKSIGQRHLFLLLQLTTFILQFNMQQDLGDAALVLYKRFKDCEEKNEEKQIEEDPAVTLKEQLLQKTMKQRGIIGDHMTKKLQVTQKMPVKLPVNHQSLFERFFELVLQVQVAHRHYGSVIDIVQDEPMNATRLKTASFCASQIKDLKFINQIMKTMNFNEEELLDVVQYLLQLAVNVKYDAKLISDISGGWIDALKAKLDCATKDQVTKFERIQFLRNYCCQQELYKGVLKEQKREKWLNILILKEAIRLNDAETIDIVQKDITAGDKDSKIPDSLDINASYDTVQDLAIQLISCAKALIVQRKPHQALLNHIIGQISQLKQIGFVLYCNFVSLCADHAVYLRSLDRPSSEFIDCFNKFSYTTIDFAQFAKYPKTSLLYPHQLARAFSELCRASVTFWTLGNQIIMQQLSLLTIEPISKQFQDLQLKFRENNDFNFYGCVYHPLKCVQAVYLLSKRQYAQSMSAASSIMQFYNTQSLEKAQTQFGVVEKPHLQQQFVELNLAVIFVADVDQKCREQSQKFLTQVSPTDDFMQQLNIFRSFEALQLSKTGDNSHLRLAAVRELGLIMIQQLSLQQFTITDLQLYLLRFTGQTLYDTKLLTDLQTQIERATSQPALILAINAILSMQPPANDHQLSHARRFETLGQLAAKVLSISQADRTQLFFIQKSQLAHFLLRNPGEFVAAKEKQTDALARWVLQERGLDALTVGLEAASLYSKPQTSHATDTDVFSRTMIALAEIQVPTPKLGYFASMLQIDCYFELITSLDKLKVADRQARIAQKKGAETELKLAGEDVKTMAAYILGQQSERQIEKQQADAAMDQPELRVLVLVMKQLLQTIGNNLKQLDLAAACAIVKYFELRQKLYEGVQTEEAALIVVLNRFLCEFETQIVAGQMNTAFEPEPLKFDESKAKADTAVIRCTNPVFQEVITEKLLAEASSLQLRLAQLVQLISLMGSRDPKKPMRTTAVAALEDVSVHFDSEAAVVAAEVGCISANRLTQAGEANDQISLLRRQSLYQEIDERGLLSLIEQQKLALRLKEKQASLIVGPLSQLSFAPFCANVLVFRQRPQAESKEIATQIFDPLEDLKYAEQVVQNFGVVQNLNFLNQILEQKPLKTNEEVADYLLTNQALLVTLFDPLEVFLNERLRVRRVTTKVMVLLSCELQYTSARSQRWAANDIQKYLMAGSSLYVLLVHLGVSRIVVAQKTYQQLAEVVQKLEQTGEKQMTEDVKKREKVDVGTYIGQGFEVTTLRDK